MSSPALLQNHCGSAVKEQEVEVEVELEEEEEEAVEGGEEEEEQVAEKRSLHRSQQVEPSASKTSETHRRNSS